MSINANKQHLTQAAVNNNNNKQQHVGKREKRQRHTNELYTKNRKNRGKAQAKCRSSMSKNSIPDTIVHRILLL